MRSKCNCNCSTFQVWSNKLKNLAPCNSIRAEILNILKWSLPHHTEAILCRMAQDHQMLGMFSFDIELRKVLHEEPHCGSLGGHGKSQACDEHDKISTKVDHLTHNIQCDIQAQILDNLIFTYIYSVSALIPRFSASMSSPDCRAAQGSPLAQHNSLAECGWAHQKRYSWGNMSAPLLFDVPNSSLYLIQFDDVKKPERNSLIKQAMRNRNMQV